MITWEKLKITFLEYLSSFTKIHYLLFTVLIMSLVLRVGVYMLTLPRTLLTILMDFAVRDPILRSRGEA